MIFKLLPIEAQFMAKKEIFLILPLFLRSAPKSKKTQLIAQVFEIFFFLKFLIFFPISLFLLQNVIKIRKISPYKKVYL